MNQIKSVTKNYRIYFTKGPTSDEGDYMLDHRNHVDNFKVPLSIFIILFYQLFQSIIIYLINPNSVYQNHFMDRAQPPDEIYSVIRQQFKLFDRFNS